MDEEYNLDDLFKFQEWASQKSTQFSENVTSVGTATPPLPDPVAPCVTPNNIPPALSQHQHTYPSNSTFLQEGEWNPDRTYESDFPNCLRYLIEWQVTLNGKAISKDTEPEVSLAPSCYWQLVLQAQPEELLQKKFPRSRGVRSEDTTVVVSVTERSQRDLTKRFDQTNIDWAIVEKQLCSWCQYFQKDKRLRFNLSFNYIEPTRPFTRAAARRGDKRGSTSATQLMLAQRNLHVNAEEEASDRPAVWQNIYTIFRCPGSCNRGPHCWIDPDGKRHYRLRAPHMRSLIEYVAKDGILETHDDVPPDIRQQLYLEEQQRQDRKAKENASSPLSIPPINITNVLPGHSHPMSLQGGQQGGVASMHPSTTANTQQLGIPSFRDDALREYTEWQQSKVRDPLLKVEFAKARDAALKVGFDLEQIYELVYIIFSFDRVIIICGLIHLCIPLELLNAPSCMSKMTFRALLTASYHIYTPFQKYSEILSWVLRTLSNSF